jgi:hypothetical protein
MKTTTKNSQSKFEIKTNVIYSCRIDSLTVNLGGVTVDVTKTLKSGRTNYETFESIICKFLPLKKGTSIDLVDPVGNKFEVKSYLDDKVYPGNKRALDSVHTAASKAFGPNNSGPRISRLVKENEYGEALSICKSLSYDKIDYFIYTNTRQFDNSQPFKFMVIKKADVMSWLDHKDPRCVSRQALLDSCTDTINLELN